MDNTKANNNCTNAAPPPQIPHCKSRNGTYWPQSVLKASVEVLVGPSELLWLNPISTRSCPAAVDILFCPEEGVSWFGCARLEMRAMAHHA